MLQILQGLLLFLSLTSTYVHAESANVVPNTIAAENTTSSADPMINGAAIELSEEEKDAQTIAEITAETKPVTIETNSQQVLGKEMKGIKETQTEAQIPVLTTTNKKTEKSADPMTRLVMSLGVLLVVTGGLFMFARFWAKRKTGLTQNHQIKVLTQYGLGPKKSLAIIRVAGESILIGVTEHNISMIKSLALLDEDLPLEVPSKFNQELDRAEHKSAQFEMSEKEDFNFGSVRDIVASRLREMRSL